MDQEGRRTGRFGGIVARHASIVAIMRGRRALYPQREIELADMVCGSLPRLQWPAVLQPSDLQGWIALADRAGHVHPRARLDIVGKAKRIDFRRYCKLQEALGLFHRRARHVCGVFPSFSSILRVATTRRREFAHASKETFRESRGGREGNFRAFSDATFSRGRERVAVKTPVWTIFQCLARKKERRDVDVEKNRANINIFTFTRLAISHSLCYPLDSLSLSLFEDAFRVSDSYDATIVS